MADIRMVVFDLGGVMIRLTRGWAEACARAEVPYHPLSITPSLQASLDRLEVGISTNAISPEAFYQALHEVMERLYSPAEVERAYQAIICEEFPGIECIVTSLNDAGYATACLSNTCAPHWVDLTDARRYPGIAALSCQHASHLFGLAKPDPAIYQRFVAETGVAPETILFFDDRADNVLAAAQCGWHAVQITGDDTPEQQIRAALKAHGVDLQDVAHDLQAC